MAPGRSRSSKRPSASSYTSTITTIAFIALCVIGVWMLTSTSVVPPQTTTRTTSTSTSSTTSRITSAVDNEADVSPQNINEVTNKKDPSVYEDNPGDLPDDAIKSDEAKVNNVNENDKEESNGDNGRQATGVDEESTQSGETQTSEEGTVTQNQQTENAESEHENQHINNDDNNNNNNANKEQNETGDNPQESDTQKSDGDQQDDTQQQQQQQQRVENTKNSQDSQITENEQPQQQQQQSVENTKNSQDSQITENEQPQQQQQQQQSQQEVEGIDKNQQEPQNPKSYEEQQQLQRQEDAGVQNTSQESQNEVSEEDQQESIHQQQQQRQQNQQQQKQVENSDETTMQQQQPQHEFSDVTTPVITHNQNQETKQESESESSKESETPLTEEKSTESNYPGGGTRKESKESKKAWSTQATESENQKERRKEGTESDGKESMYRYTWQLCNVSAGADYIPCLDNEKAVRQLHSTKHFEHRERHCPEEGPICLVPVPVGYKKPIPWPKSRDKIWYHNVPHTLLAEVKGHQNWVKVTGEFLTFPGGGTQFIHGALHYIDFVEQAVANIGWGKHTRVILDVGCGVASFGGYLFDKNVLAMSFAPKDEHEAQVQFALERGIPAISAVMGSQRLPFPSRVFDLLHCARCRVPWHAEGGMLLLELNRVLRPGGYFVWSATPVYQKLEEDVEIWKAMSALTASMCWELVTIQKDKLNSIGAAIYRKPTTNDCYDQRQKNSPPMCKSDDDPNAAWYVPLQACMHRVPVGEAKRGTQWPEDWPHRLQTPPYWLNSSQMGIYGKPAPQDFVTDYEHWKHVVNKSYLNGLGISWSNVRNVMDMRAVYGGFAAALKDLDVWVLNVVNIDSPDTLPIIYERGLFGIYHDWCESFSTYPRTYDLLHADHLFSRLMKRCKLGPVMAEVDRIVRPGGKLIIRDESTAIAEVENFLKSLRWEVHLTFSKDQEGLLSAQKGDWRPQTYATSS